MPGLFESLLPVGPVNRRGIPDIHSRTHLAGGSQGRVTIQKLYVEARVEERR
jgi:hypothetical protein